MKLQNGLKAFFMAARIEYHWQCILRGRKRADRLIAGGMELTSRRLLQLNSRLMRHGLAAMQQERIYESLFCTPVKGNI